jgi:hypothetical protein
MLPSIRPPAIRTLYIRAIAANGVVLARSAGVVGNPAQGHVIALLVAPPQSVPKFNWLALTSFACKTRTAKF